MLFLLPLMAALAAPALLRLRAVPLAAALALGIAVSLWVQSDWRYENADWRGAIERIESAAPGLPVIVVTPLGQPVAAHYLDRAPSTSVLPTRRAWLVVEPARVPGRRDFAPADTPAVASLLAAFPTHREHSFHGFRLIDLRASAPVTLDPAALGGATLFAPR